MKKMGFTLVEVLVALAILAIGAALLAPIVSGLRPDANKAKLLKVHKLTKETIQELLADTSLYMNHSNTAGTCEGLNCMTTPSSSNYNNATYSANDKFPNLFASRLSLVGNVTKTNDKWNFQTTDGIDWIIEKLLTFNTTSIYKFTVDVDGANAGENCVYGSSNCSVPDTFTFEIDKWGNFSNRDKLMQAYLVNPLKINDKARDLANAANQGSDAPPSLSESERTEQEQEQTSN